MKILVMSLMGAFDKSTPLDGQQGAVFGGDYRPTEILRCSLPTPLYNLVPYQRRAQHAGKCGVEVEGGRVPTRDWFLNVQILTSGGFR
jgi:hypothetical protein